MAKATTTICYWSDGSWCHYNKLPQFYDVGEEFKTVWVPLATPEHEIDDLVAKLLTIGE